jgi:hypothetical protein
VTATAADGYAVEISADEMEGGHRRAEERRHVDHEGGTDKGPIRLVCPETPANRWVFQVQKIQVNP